MEIRENKNGERNITDLRRAVAKLENLRYRKDGAGWVIAQKTTAGWYEGKVPHHWTERQVLEDLLDRAADLEEMAAEAR